MTLMGSVIRLKIMALCGWFSAEITVQLLLSREAWSLGCLVAILLEDLKIMSHWLQRHL